MKTQKNNGHTDAVRLYHLHNSEWKNNYILNEMKKKELAKYRTLPINENKILNFIIK
jgi:hypothetical protein